MFVAPSAMTSDKVVEELKKGSAKASAFDDGCDMWYELCIVCCVWCFFKSKIGLVWCTLQSRQLRGES